MSPKPATKKAGAARARNQKAASEPFVPLKTNNAIDGDDQRRIEKLRAIVQILEASSLADLKYEDADIIVALSRHSVGPASIPPMSVAALPHPVAHPLSVAPQAPAATAGVPANTAAASPPEPAEALNVFVVRSPFIGTFYRSPSPDAEPFVEQGQPVRRGQTLCIVEAMKLMNEIESEVDGVVLEAVAENGKPVQYGDALFKIRKNG